MLERPALRGNHTSNLFRAWIRISNPKKNRPEIVFFLHHWRQLMSRRRSEAPPHIWDENCTQCMVCLDLNAVILKRWLKGDTSALKCRGRRA